MNAITTHKIDSARLTEERIAKSESELRKEIDRVKGNPDFYGTVTVQINFKQGVPQHAKIETSRTLQ